MQFYLQPQAGVRKYFDKGTDPGSPCTSAIALAAMLWKFLQRWSKFSLNHNMMHTWNIWEGVIQLSLNF
jgi:hypothetical protein